MNQRKTASLLAHSGTVRKVALILGRAGGQRTILKKLICGPSLCYLNGQNNYSHELNSLSWISNAFMVPGRSKHRSFHSKSHILPIS